MTEKIRSVEEYFDSMLEDAPRYTNLIIVLDPQRFLGKKLEEKHTDNTGKMWKVYHFYENDFTFKREYSKEQYSKEQITSLSPHLIWITFPEIRKKNKINISYINNIISKAELVIDLGLTSILKKAVPRETWFKPEELDEYSKEICENFEEFIKSHKELRKEFPQGVPLNLNHIKVMILACCNKNLTIKDLIFNDLDSPEVIFRYLKIAWSYDLAPNDNKLLKELIKNETPLDANNFLPWLEEDTSIIAVFLFLMRIFKKYNVDNPMIQLKGLGLLELDPEKLDSKQTEKIVSLIENETNLSNKITEIAEDKISLKDIYRFIECIGFESQKDIGDAIMNEKSALMVFGLSSHLINKIAELKPISFNNIKWANDVVNHPIFKNKINSELSEKAGKLLNLLYELNQIQDILSKEYIPKKDIASIIDWYRDSKIYLMELIFARAKRNLKVLDDQKLKKSIGDYLDDLGSNIRKHLQKADLNLAYIIESNNRDYFNHPRLSTNILKSNIIDRGFTFKDERKLWVLLFDGMRLDTWEQIVKPIISNKFEITEEKLYLTVLPSFTDIARIALLAGCLPSNWKDYDGNPTSDHNILSSKLFGLSQGEARAKLRVIVSSEADYAQRKLDEYDAPYNILIYNLSDDWIHSHKGDISQLNDEIEQTLRKNILPDIESRIKENDIILITSDHGFIELSKYDGIRVNANENDLRKISYRHLDGIEHDSGLKIQYDANRSYTLAKGRQWFEREGGRFSRYNHGGISLGEMVIPAAILKKIIVPEIKFNIVCPHNIVTVEDKEAEILLMITNEGNQTGEFNLVIKTNTGEEKIFSERLPPRGGTQCKFSFIPILKIKNIAYYLSYMNANKKEIKESKNVPIIVTPRKDKVEFSFGALDKLG